MTENITPAVAAAETPVQIVGHVTPAERDEIQALYERKNGLTELFRIIAVMNREQLDSNGLYERMVTDMGQVATQFQQWWDRMSRQYHWESVPDGRWEIDFATCAITLRT
jgi:CXXX repeat modification system protein